MVLCELYLKGFDLTKGLLFDTFSKDGARYMHVGNLERLRSRKLDYH